jgi:hypothetical protein
VPWICGKPSLQYQTLGGGWPWNQYIYLGVAMGSASGRGIRNTAPGQLQLGSHKELLDPVPSMTKWDDVRPWGTQLVRRAPRSLNAVPVFTLALADVPGENNNRTTIMLCSM